MNGSQDFMASRLAERRPAPLDDDLFLISRAERKALARACTRVLWRAGLAAFAMTATLAHAQVQRSFINLGFEEPNLGNPGCRVYIQESLVPGWTTNHPPQFNWNLGCAMPPGFDFGFGPQIEIWKTPRAAVVARSGTQLAELNADVPARISQNICFIAGEQVSWRFSHSGRNSDTTQDRMQFLIGPSPIVEVGTTNTGAGGVITTFQGTAGSVAGPTTWRDYSGAFTVPGASGVTSIGFEAISASGGLAAGNFLDDIQITIRPLIEFESATYSQPEQGPVTNVRVRIVGIVPPGGITVPLTTSGTATLSSDYTLGTFTIPAGDYGTGTTVDVPLTVVNDTLVENNETVILTIPPHSASSSYVLGSTSLCGGVAIGSATLTIVDNDVDLLTTKATSTATPAAGVPFTFTVTYRNNTAAPTVAPANAHDVGAASVADAVPTGLTFGAWTCTASGGASCPGGTVNGSTNGSGAIGGTAALPAGSGGAGGQITYTITATAGGPPNCAAITNTSTISTPAAFQEGSAVQGGFASPAAGGTANNMASAIVTPVCTTLRLVKTWAGAVIGDTANLATTGAANNAALVSTANSADESDTGPAASVLAGEVVTLSETLGAGNAGLYTAGAWSCTGTSGLAGNVLTVGPTDTAIVCSITNARRQADLRVSKSASPTGTVPAGQTITYTIAARNNGPDAAHGASIMDGPATGLTCPRPGTTPSCAASGGATCPGSLAGLFVAPGVAVPIFPAGGSIAITLQCVVN